MNTASTCPKCGYTSSAPFSECERCGIIVAKFLQRAEDNQRPQGSGRQHQNSDGDPLAEATGLMIKQKKEWGEILTGFETKNRYEVTDLTSNPMMDAEEQGGSAMETLTRFFLKSLRPFKINLITPQGNILYQLNRPFRFYFHELEIKRADNTYLGSVKRKFSIMRRIYTVCDHSGNEIFELFGPLLHPWTFHIKRGLQELGQITKKWSGLAKESFTDADNFGILFPANINPDQKAILLGAVFLIDFVHFENSGKRSSIRIGN